MAEEVEIGNIGKGGVASDATLERLIKAVEKLNKSGTSSTTPEDVKKLGEESKKLGTETKKTTGEVGEFGEEIENTTTLVEDFGSGLKSGLVAVYDSAVDLAKELINGGDRFSDFTRHIPVVGGILTSVVKNFEEGVDAFRTLSESGAAFGNSLINLKGAAAAANLPLDMFVNTISANSQSMLFLGGTITDGAKRFGQLSNTLRNSSEDFLGMGFTMESLNEHTAGYLELQARLGRLQGMSQQQLAQGAGDYLKELDRLAKVTGMSRKEAEQLMKQQAQEANVAAIQSRLSGDALKNFQSGLAFVENQMPGLSGAFKDLADGVAQTDVGQKIAALAPGLADLFKQVGQGTVPLEQLQQRLKDNLPELTKLRDGLGGAAVSALMGEAGFGELFQSIYEADVFIGKTFDPKRAEAEQKQRDEATKRLAGFEQVIANVRSAFTTAFINSGVLELIAKQIADFGDLFAETGQDLANTVKEIFEDDRFKAVVANFRTVLENLKDKFGAIASDIASFNFSAALDKLFAGTSNPFSAGGAAGSSAGGGVSNLGEFDMGSNQSSGGGGFNLLDYIDIPWGEVAAGLGLVVAGLAAAGLAANAAIPGFGALATALLAFTAAAVGVGIAMQAYASLQEASAERTRENTQAVQALSDISTDQLHATADGIEAIGDALANLGGGALDGISSAIGGLFGGGMGDTVEHMQAIAAISPKLKEAGVGMADLSDASKTLDSSRIEAYTEAIEELAEAMEKLNEELGRDNNGLMPGTGTNAGTVMQNMSGGGNSVADKLDQLNTLMTQMLMVLEQGTRYSRDTTRAIRGQGDLQQGF